MDPITAIGLASSILTFVDFSAKLISGAAEVYGSPSGLTADDKSAQSVAAEMQRLVLKLHPPDDSSFDGDDKAICRLATDCEAICEEILALIERNRPKSRGSRSAALLAGLKSRWRESERRRLEERLANCRSQLVLQIQYLTSADIKAKLDTLIESTEGNSKQLMSLSKQLSGINKDISISKLSLECRNLGGPLHSLSEHAIDSIVQQLILKALRFAEKNDRYEALLDAHFGTYEWIFRGSPASGPGHDPKTDQQEQSAEDIPPPYSLLPQDENTTAKLEARNRLFDWLKSGDGIFHISGKLGSGKSTLMKYLCEHSATKTMLTAWAGHRRLVFASFFFWRPGSTLQRSQTGLIYSILHDVLDHCRELIPFILPEAWKTVRLGLPLALFTDKKVRIHEKEIQAGFARLISDPGLYERYCFCFFIDGLDEYEGTYREDHKFLVDHLCSWTTNAPNVKLCVSSREYNVFMNAFSAFNRIRLHQLTRSDMKHYTSDKLGHLHTADKVAITKAIVDNASGIFLWVVLVTRRIRELIEDGCTTSDLLRELDALPRELDDLFEHLLSTLPKTDRKNAYQVFLMLICLKKYHPNNSASLRLLSLSFLDAYNKDRKFATNEKTCPAEIGMDEVQARRVATAQRIQGYCRGFVDVVEGQFPSNGPMVEFTHRSVPEFLSTEFRMERMKSFLNEFDPLDAVSQMRLAEAFAVPDLCCVPGRSEDIYPFILPLRAVKGKDTPPYEFPEAICRAIMRYLSKGKPLVNPDWSGGYGRCTAAAFETGQLGRTNYNTAHCKRPAALHEACAADPQHPIYSAVFMSNYGYAKWKLTQPSGVGLDINLDILLYFLVAGYRFMEDKEGSIEFVDFLIKQGLTPQKPSDVSYFKIHVVDEAGPDVENSPTMTVWQHLLLNCYGFAGALSVPFRLGDLGYIMERFLEYGADPYFQISVEHNGKHPYDPTALEYKEWIWQELETHRDGGIHETRDFMDQASEEARSSLCIKLVLGKERRKLTLKFDKEVFNSTMPYMPYRLKAESLYEYLSLYEDGFYNWDRLKELIERNMRMFGGDEVGGDLGAEELPGGEEAAYGEAGGQGTAIDKSEKADHDGLTGLVSFALTARFAGVAAVMGVLLAFLMQLLAGRAAV